LRAETEAFTAPVELKGTGNIRQRGLGDGDRFRPIPETKRTKSRCRDDIVRQRKSLRQRQRVADGGCLDGVGSATDRDLRTVAPACAVVNPPGREGLDLDARVDALRDSGKLAPMLEKNGPRRLEAVRRRLR